MSYKPSRIRLPFDLEDRILCALFGKTIGLCLSELGAIVQEMRPWRFTNALVGNLWKDRRVEFTCRRRVILARTKGAALELPTANGKECSL